MAKKKIMILGAGIFQVPIIKKAKELNYYSICVSNIKDDVGFKYADKSILCSTIDKAGVLEFAKTEGIDGIVTIASEIAATTVAYVAEHLKLSGYPYASAVTISNKHFLRDFLNKNKIDPVSCGYADNFTDASKVYDSIEGLCVIKPVLASGSKGVSLVHNKAELEEYFDIALSSSYIFKGVIIEEYLLGQMLGGLCVIVEGEISFIAISKKYTNDDLVPIGHIFPAKLTDEQTNSIKVLLDKCVKGLELTNGVLDFDIILTKTGPKIIEFGGRLGGNNISDLLEIHTGIDMVEVVLKLSLGEPVEIKDEGARKNIAVFLKGSQSDGVVKRIFSINDLFAKHSEHCISEAHYVKPGDKVNRFSQGSFQIGNIIIEHSNWSELDELLGDFCKTNWIEMQ